MTHYNTLNLKLSDLQLNKLKSARKNGTEVTLNLSSNLIGNCNDKANDKANGSSPIMTFSKTQLPKIQSGGFTFSLPSDIIFNKGAIPLVSSVVKESKNMGAKKDAGHLIGKKIKKGFHQLIDESN